MEINYNKSDDSLVIHFVSYEKENEYEMTETINPENSNAILKDASESILFDFNKDKKIIGIEFLQASKYFPKDFLYLHSK